MIQITILAVILAISNANLLGVYEAAKEAYKSQTDKDWSLNDLEFLRLPSEAQFNEFKESFGKTYQDSEEHERRFLNFQMNHLLAKAYQASDQGSAEYGITKFSDLAPEEFKIYYRNLQVQSLQLPSFTAPDLPTERAPTSFDWRQHNAVTQIKDQGQCGSCWSFSTTGNIEAQWSIHKQQLISLSEQQIVDCDSTCFGCNGGWPSKAFQYVIGAGGVMGETDYPYFAKQYDCAVDANKFIAMISNWTRVSQDEAQMASYLAQKGPLSILINAGPMQYYRGGIAHPTVAACDPKALDHAVLAVGYGVDASTQTPFWIVKNSWGAAWGEQGYWRVYRGGDVCGIASTATAAII